jgi:hypothetical protein
VLLLAAFLGLVECDIDVEDPGFVIQLLCFDVELFVFGLFLLTYQY